MYMPHIKFQDSSISGSRVSQLPSITDRQTDGQTDRRTDGRTDRPKPICPLNFSEVGGIKSQISSICYVLALELPNRGDSNEYTQYYIFNMNKKKHPKSSQICSYGLFSMGLKNEFETAVLKFYCIWQKLVHNAFLFPRSYDILVAYFTAILYSNVLMLYLGYSSRFKCSLKVYAVFK